MVDRKQGDGASRRRRAIRSAGLGVIAAGLLVSPESALGDEVLGAGFSGFFEASPHVVVQRGRGNGESNFGAPNRKSNILTNMTFRFGGGFKSPALDSVWGKPRVVLFGAALVPINESSTIGTEFVETSLPQTGTELIESAKFTIEYQTSGAAGLGLEFAVPVFDSEITIRPGVESLHLVSRYVGSLFFQRTFIGGQTEDPREVRVKEVITQHFFGPSLRIGTPSLRFKGVSFDFFLDTSLLLDVAGTRKEARDTRPNGDSGTFEFETGSGLVQVGAGLQIRWP